MERENITNVPTLKIYKLTEAQYRARLEAGKIDENAFYFTETAEKDSYLPQSAGNMIVTLDENDVLNYSFIEIQTHI